MLRCWRGVAHRAIEGTHVVLVNTVAAGAVAASELAIFINCRTAREEDRPVLVFFWHHVKRSAEVAARVKRVEAEHGLERRGRLWGTDVVASLRVDTRFVEDRPDARGGVVVARRVTRHREVAEGAGRKRRAKWDARQPILRLEIRRCVVDRVSGLRRSDVERVAERVGHTVKAQDIAVKIRHGENEPRVGRWNADLGPRFFRLRDALVDDSRDICGGEHAAIFRGNEPAGGLCHPVEGRRTAGRHGPVRAVDGARTEPTRQVEQGLHAQGAGLRSKALERDPAQIDPCGGIDLVDLLLQRLTRQITRTGDD